MTIQITRTRLNFHWHIVTTRQSVYYQVILHDHNTNVVILSPSILGWGVTVHCTTYVTHPIYTVVCVRIVYCMNTDIIKYCILYFKTPREYIIFVIRIDRTRPGTHPSYTVVCVRMVFCMNTEINVIIVFCTSKHRVNTLYSLSVLIGRVPGRILAIRMSDSL